MSAGIVPVKMLLVMPCSLPFSAAEARLRRRAGRGSRLSGLAQNRSLVDNEYT
jgi:hypothetical protein